MNAQGVMNNKLISDENINRFQQNKLSKLDQMNKLDEEKRNIRLQKNVNEMNLMKRKTKCKKH